MLSSGLLLGLALGFVFMYLWKTMMAHRDKTRKQKVVAGAVLRRVTLQELRNVLTDNTPTWLNFSEYDKVNWLNMQLKELWPHVNNAASNLVMESVEPILKQSAPSGVTDIGFHKFKLGIVAPQIDGIKVHSVTKSQAIMDLQFNWPSDMSIILRIEALKVPLQVQVKDLVFVAEMRIIMQFTDNLPCIAAVVASIKNKPAYRLEYTLKAVGGSLNAVPGLSGMIKDAIKGPIDSMLLWPERLVVPLDPGYPARFLEMRYMGCLVVTVLKAEGLKNVDIIGKSDPYVRMWLRMEHKAETSYKKNSLNPTWDETFVLPVDDPHSAELTIQVKDEGELSDTVLGCALYPVADLLNARDEMMVTLDLLPRLHDDTLFGLDHGLGRITLKFMYRSYSDEEKDRVTAAEKKRKPSDVDKQPLTASEVAAVKEAARQDMAHRHDESVAVRAAGAAVLAVVGMEHDAAATAAAKKEGTGGLAAVAKEKAAVAALAVAATEHAATTEGVKVGQVPRRSTDPPPAAAAASAAAGAAGAAAGAPPPRAVSPAPAVHGSGGNSSSAAGGIHKAVSDSHLVSRGSSDISNGAGADGVSNQTSVSPTHSAGHGEGSKHGASPMNVLRGVGTAVGTFAHGLGNIAHKHGDKHHGKHQLEEHDKAEQQQGIAGQQQELSPTSRGSGGFMGLLKSPRGHGHRKSDFSEVPPEALGGADDVSDAGSEAPTPRKMLGQVGHALGSLGHWGKKGDKDKGEKHHE